MEISSQTYTPAEEAEVEQWLSTCRRLLSLPGDAPILDALNLHLASRTTILGTKPSRADVAVYNTLAPAVADWSSEQRTGQQGRPNIVRHLDFVQNSKVFELDSVDSAPKIRVDVDDILYVKPPVDAKAKKERLKQEKAAAAAASGAAAGVTTTIADRTKEAVDLAKEKAVDSKAAVSAAVGVGGEAKPKKEKKEKAAKQAKAPAAAAAPTPSLIDLRVGHILKAIKHPEADSLYVSTIAMGDKEKTEDYVEHDGQICRTVCSGLSGLVPLEDMQGRKVVVVANLKPVKMRGIKSCAMVLAASPRLKESEVDEHKGPVELVSPPANSEAGERVYFEGWEGEPEGVLNPKKKIWEIFQPGFTTTDNLEVAFDAGAVKETGKDGLAKLVTKGGGSCTVKTLMGATVR